MKQELNLTQEWDKVFPLSDKVNHRKVTFETQYGLTLAADLYTPKAEVVADLKSATQESGISNPLQLPAIAVSGPFGAVKEQSSGLYAMRMAERGFVALAFDPLPDEVPQFVKDYHAYYKTPRGYHARSGNSNDGWRVIGTQAYANNRFLYYINEIRSAVLVMHGSEAHSRYFGEAAYKYMVDGQAEGYNFIGKPNPNPENKELLIIPGATHCDLYDGGEGNYIPWDTLAEFFGKNL